MQHSLATFWCLDPKKSEKLKEKKKIIRYKAYEEELIEEPRRKNLKINEQTLKKRCS